MNFEYSFLRGKMILFSNKIEINEFFISKNVLITYTLHDFGLLNIVYEDILLERITFYLHVNVQLN